ncbi:MAG: VOC family protein [Gammaproteobacteria bacterium]|nr:MAG: VOC family protein [Gammaproteobacteria bacterium]
MRHVALFVEHLHDCVEFYTQVLGMRIEWNPDPDNFYLTSGNDNLALHRFPGEVDHSGPQRLDHIGFILDKPGDVDDWYLFMKSRGVVMKTSPRTHRDGARSFYCFDPDGNTVQMIHHPPISAS